VERWLLAELEMDRAAKPEDEDNRMTLSYVRPQSRLSRLTLLALILRPYAK